MKTFARAALMAGAAWSAMSVQALAQQLSATLETADAKPGTRVTVHHTQIALVKEDAAYGAAQSAARRPTSQVRE